MKLWQFAPPLALLLAACTSAPEECDTFAECDRLLATARIDGRPLSVTLDASEDNGVTGLGDAFGTVTMIAYRPRSEGGEGVQFWLDGFHGAGAYPVVDSYGDGTAMAAYWWEAQSSGAAYWGEGGEGDTVWVTAYDSVSRAIAGRFQFTAGIGEHSVEVTAGEFAGTVRPHDPEGSTIRGASPYD